MKLLRRQLSLILFLLALLAIPIIPVQSSASFCGTERSACEEYGRADAVLIGEAMDGSKPVEAFDHEWKKIILQSGIVRFIVRQSFKGIKGNEIDVATSGRGCGISHFKKGQTYMLYLLGNYTEGFRILSGTRSRHVSAAGEDLKFLSDLTAKECEVRLYGAVGTYYVEEVKTPDSVRRIGRVRDGILGITVTATDAQGRIHKAVTNQEGAYEFKGILPDIEYKVKADLPVNFSPTRPEEAQIKKCGCARVDFTKDKQEK